MSIFMLRLVSLPHDLLTPRLLPLPLLPPLPPPPLHHLDTRGGRQRGPIGHFRGPSGSNLGQIDQRPRRIACDGAGRGFGLEC